MGFYETVNLEKGKVMCKYCNVDSFGECLEFIDELKHDITINGIKVANIHTCIINDDDNEWYLNIFMIMSNGEEISSKQVRIEYCPFCGRKLN